MTLRIQYAIVRTTANCGKDEAGGNIEFKTMAQMKAALLAVEQDLKTFINAEEDARIEAMLQSSADGQD